MSSKRENQVQVSENANFWHNRTPCWEILHCPEDVRNDCPAYYHRQYPCWEIEGTYSKWLEWGSLGLATDICVICKVYLTYGKGKPIRLTLRGKGIKLLIRR